MVLGLVTFGISNVRYAFLLSFKPVRKANLFKTTPTYDDMVRHARTALSYLLAIAPIAAIDGKKRERRQLGTSAWSYLSTDLPTSLSDMGGSLLSFPTDSSSNSNAHGRRIVLTGGCVDPDGNVYKEMVFGNETVEFFECTQLSDKVGRLCFSTKNAIEFSCS